MTTGTPARPWRTSSPLTGLTDAAGPGDVAKQHSAGKLTARERIDELLDAGTFVEVGALVTPSEGLHGAVLNAPADGVVAGLGIVDGRPVSVYSTDFPVYGGSPGDAGMLKIQHMVDVSLRRGIPHVMLIDGRGTQAREMRSMP